MGQITPPPQQVFQDVAQVPTSGPEPVADLVGLLNRVLDTEFSGVDVLVIVAVGAFVALFPVWRAAAARWLHKITK